MYRFTEQINSTHLTSNTTDAVVHLPESVAISHRRISFVVFRNDRAFLDNRSVSVNSRILSIRVENVTEFGNGEVSIKNVVFTEQQHFCT